MEKTRTKYICLLSAAAVVLALAIWFGEQYYRYRWCNFVSRDGEKHGYYVRPGMSVDSVIAAIEADYALGSSIDWRLHSRYLHFDTCQVGFYRLPARIGDKELIRRLMLGQQTPVRLSWTHQVRTREQLSSRLSKQLLMDSVAIAERLDSAEYMAAYGLKRETAVCLFLPDTYEVWWTLTPDQLFERMGREYRRFWNEERLHRADSMHLTPTEVATLASIVESETNRQQEYPLIASLYLNRLHRRMPLQACPTVIFAVGDFSMRRVLKRHLRIESPYNTYRNIGLPPGPIRCARKTTMDAVLQAPKTDYLYMCANPDWSGTHVFSSSYSNHAATARAYQRELNKRKIR